MARQHQGARALVIGLAAALLAPIAVSAPAGAATDAGSIDPGNLRGRAGQVLAGQLDASDADVRTGAEKVAAASTGRTKPSRTKQDPSARDGASLAAPGDTTYSAQAVACVPDDFWLNTLADRTVVHASSAGAASITVQRQREYGTWRTVGSASTSSVVVDDRTNNQRAFTKYRLIAKSSSGAVLEDCVTEDFQGTWTRDGWGESDAVVATTSGVYQQGRWDQGDRSTTGDWVGPAYSTDGRLFAVTRTDAAVGHPVLEVRRSSTSAVVFTVDLGSSFIPADPAFSYDGQTLAYSRYDANGEPVGLGFVDVFGSHTKRSVTTEPPAAEPAWRPDGTLVVSTFGTDADGLGTLCATCATVTPLSGTAGGYTAEVGPDGTVWFTTDNGTTSTLKKRTAAGTVTTLRTSTTDSYTSPRLTLDGTLYVERDTPDPVTPDAYSVGVYVVAPGGATNGDDDELTAIGWEDAPDGTGLAGWDVRQPQSKGSSNRTAEGHHDLIARDSAGALWAYRNTGWELTGRAQIGSGWGIYNTVVALGDLTGDDQADLVARDSAGTLWLYRGRPGGGGFLARTQFGTGWGSYTIVGPGDWNGDDRADIVARDGKGVLWLYAGTGRGSLAPRVQIGTGWSGITAIVASGDADFDGKTDLIARDGLGKLFVYPGNGTGGFLARRQIGTGWGGFTSLTVTETTYGRAQVWARTATGDLVGYELYADGTFVPGEVFSEGGGWKTMLLTA
ncbi:FG-GAP-like repeat-containing protein [Terrabacter sp. LjRoot27]|uniref:VCBS repeat-containing protein n=1 Tax=Terrabacter sp. LjRoot27 TaxID=3342306 RepID=UPI003ECF79EB